MAVLQAMAQYNEYSDLKYLRKRSPVRLAEIRKGAEWLAQGN
jgi:hypothetical protein